MFRFVVDMLIVLCFVLIFGLTFCRAQCPGGVCPSPQGYLGAYSQRSPRFAFEFDYDVAPQPFYGQQYGYQPYYAPQPFYGQQYAQQSYYSAPQIQYNAPPAAGVQIYSSFTPYQPQLRRHVVRQRYR